MTNNLTPSGDEVLEQLGINPHNLRTQFPTREQRLQYRAVVQWLTDYKPKSDATNLDKVRHYTESLHCLCKVKALTLVYSIVNLRITIRTTTAEFSLPLSEYLSFKTLFYKLLEISNEIISSFQSEENNLSSIQILKAIALSGMDNLTESISIYEKLLQTNISEEILVEVYARLASCKIQGERFEEGIKDLNHSLMLIEKYLCSGLSLDLQEKFLKLKANLLTELAYYKMNSSKFDEANNLYSEALNILDENKILHVRLNPLVHKGIILRKLFRTNDSIDVLEQAMVAARDIESEEALIWIAHHLAWAFRMEKKYQEAESNCLLSLEGYKKINAERGINDCYELLGWIKLDQDNVNSAIKYFEIALKWRKENKRTQGMASCLMSLAVAYLRKGKLLKAFGTGLKGLNLYRKTGVLNWARIYRILNFVRIFRNLLLKTK